MKKILLIVSSTLMLANSFLAQETDDDKKFHLGLKVIAQPSWFKSNDNNASKLGAGFGYGFGLVTEFRLNKTAYFVTGIGGDFEKGSIKYKYDPATLSGNVGYSVGYALDGAGDLKTVKNNTNELTYISNGDVKYNGIIERKIKTTHITVPILLKMMTKEISGFKYFGMFGGEIGIRIKARAEDKYTSSTFNSNGVLVNSLAGGTNPNININKDAAIIPIRVGMNVGIGTQYRFSGSTSLFLSVNYFHSFTNLMRRESKYMTYNINRDNNGDLIYYNVKQSLVMNAVRINIGILF
jgi:hypothetical protein